MRHAAAIFLGAFLLFQVQPLIGKHILPWFGGTPAVWSACMLFFQVLLVAGYAYAHWLDRRLGQRAQAGVHLALLVLAIGLLIWQALGWKAPLLPGVAWAPQGADAPVADILLVLGVGVGLPFLVLSATSPLVQAWYRADRPDGSPYRLYALSNAGSLLALVSYPLLFEPFAALGSQAWGWTWLFGLYGLLMGVLAVSRILRPQALNETRVATGEGESAGERPGWGQALTWLGLSACGSVLLLAVTNQVCQEVAVVPFLWVLPLTIYLVTFILAFESERWYRPRLFGPALVLFSLAGAVMILAGIYVDLLPHLIFYMLLLFVCCMVCHGELARLRPHPRYLTGFYLLVSVGGALGGVFVGFVAPVLFSGFWELHLGLFGCGLIYWLLLAKKKSGFLYTGWVRLRRVALTGWLILLGLLLLSVGLLFSSQASYQERNFYGILRVVPRYLEVARLARDDLFHGQTSHGNQLRDPASQGMPTAYFTPSSGLGHAALYHPRRQAGLPMRIGIIGLGVGTIAAYGQVGDLIRFYELNPAVARLAWGQGGYFRYLANCPAAVEVLLGDARLVMQRELDQGQPQQYDLFVVDAFSSDAIPIHLLTVEAMGLYLAHLKPDGILALHLTNRNLSLVGLAARIAGQWNMPSAHLQDPNRSATSEISDWLLVTRNAAFLDLPTVAPLVFTPLEARGLPANLWTDDFNNLLGVIH